MKKKALIRLLLLAIVSCLTLFSAQPNPGKAGMDPQWLARIQARMKSFVDQGRAAGVVTLVQRNGVLASLEAVGLQELETKKPMRPDTIFQIMSMTKPVTAVAIMILADEGLLALSDPVERHLPEFRGMWMIDSDSGEARTLKRPPRRITIRDLLTHTSGMAQMPPEPAKDLYSEMNLPLAEAVTLFSQQPLEFAPGTKWQYSNPGIATLGRIVEVNSGLSFERFLEERIFQPLGMKDSFIFPPADKLARIAMVYRFRDGKLAPAGGDILGGDPARLRKGAKYSAPEFGMYSTATDLAAFHQMVLNGGSYNGRRILSRTAVNLMTALHTGEIDAGHEPGMGYGLAWVVVREPSGTLLYRSPGTYGHGGAYGTYSWVDPEKNLVGVFLIQRVGGSPDERNAFMQIAAAAIVD